MKVCNELVSIIVPVYNVENYIEECVSSLRNQTYSNIEIILVDDESPDNCPDICEALSFSDNRIVVVHQHNKGLPGARNSGLKKAKGKWVLFVDADDWLAEDAVEKIMKSVDEMADVIVFNPRYVQQYERVTQSDDLFDILKLSERDRMNELQDVIDPMRSYKGVIKLGKMPAWSKMYSRDFLISNNISFFENVRVHEDIPFAILVYLCAKNIYYYDVELYYYRYNPDSITASYRPNYENEMKELLNTIYYIMTTKGLFATYENEYLNRVMASVIYIVLKKLCHKANNESYIDRRKDFLKMSRDEVFRDAFEKAYVWDYRFSKRIAAILVKNKMFFILDMIVKRK